MVCKELHFSKAAEKLGISQPTLSHQIKILEKSLGHPLFNRVGKKIELTKVGEIVQEEALKIQNSVENIFSKIEAFKQVEIGELRIAVLPGEITDLTSTLCIEFNKIFPNIRVYIETTDNIEKALLENRADFGIGLCLNSNELLQVTKLYDEEFYFISNELRPNEKISFPEILDKPLILFPKKHQCRKLLERTTKSIGRELEPIVETSSIKLILELVRSGVGCSVVSRTLFEFYDTEDLYYQQIENPTLSRSVYFVTKKNSFINYAAREFMKLLFREIEKLRFDTEKEAIDSLQQFIL